MSNVTIFADGTINIGSTITGYCVSQKPQGTKVVAWHNNGHTRPRDMGTELKLPQKRYTLSSEGGRAQFDADFLAAWNAAGQ